MCGIVGYLGNRKALPVLTEGLFRLEYRGYDSCGLAVFDQKSGNLFFEKSTKRLKDFFHEMGRDIDGQVGISHTRWATHGGVTEANAHPHSDCQQDIFVVHNGIIENFLELKSVLEKKGHTFKSETDTEVIPHLIEEFISQGLEYKDAVLKALNTIKGSFALVIFNKQMPDLLIGVRFASPLVLGFKDKEFILASDPTPISFLTKNVVFLNDGEVVFVSKDSYEIRLFSNGQPVSPKISKIDWEIVEASRGNYQDFMSKEIHEEADAVRNTLRGRCLIDKGLVKLAGLEEQRERLRAVDNIVIAACGTASYAGMVAQYFFEEYSGIPTRVEVASELRYRKPLYNDKSLLIAVSQSGETADTLEAVKEAKNKGILTLGVVNVPGSTISRTVDAGVYTYAGSEQAVASTKAFVSQITALALVSVFLGRQRQMSLITGRRILQELSLIPGKISSIFDQEQKIRTAAEKFARYKNFLYLGRKYNWPIALEGALKLKEISYVHAEAYPAGEMKHGPIALIDENFPSFVIAPKDSVYEKVVSNIQEIKARRGKVIALTTEANRELTGMVDELLFIPKTLEMLTPLLTTVPLHLFAYYVADKLKRDIDRPRNLAKSVTVE